MILKVNEDNFAKIDAKGNIVVATPEITVSEDGMTITIVQKTEEQLKADGYKKLVKAYVGDPKKGFSKITTSEDDETVTRTIEFKA